MAAGLMPALVIVIFMFMVFPDSFKLLATRPRWV